MKRKSDWQDWVIKSGWVLAMLAISATLIFKPEATMAGRIILGGIVTIMWAIFLVSFSGLNSFARVRELDAKIGWWLALALIVGAQLALLHLLLGMILGRSWLGAGVVILFLVGIFRFMKDFIRARQRAIAKAKKDDFSPVK